MQDRKFNYFVVLAGMRTGSNLLEEYLDAMPGIESWGELFNPHFFGKPKESTQFGLSLQARDCDPIRTIELMLANSGELPGFRLFYDHDQRVTDHILADPRAAKIVLTRRPIDSYVSLKIARKTGQWWLGDMSSQRSAKVSFDQAEYAEFVNRFDDFQSSIERKLQITGQTAFKLAYENLSDTEVITGLGKFLGAKGPPDENKVRAKVQNPTSIATRLTNSAQAEKLLGDLATPDLDHLSSYEPGRGPGLRMFRACKKVPMLYMPIRGAGVDPVPGWMHQVDPNGVTSGMTQKDLRRWKRQHSGHRSFTVLRHPLPRAYDAFCRYILPTDNEGYADIRAALKDRYDVPIPENWPIVGWSLENQRTAFLAFLKFLAGNLGGQTSLRVDNTWATQSVLLFAIGQFSVPDQIIRDEDMHKELPELAGRLGGSDVKIEVDFKVDCPYSLAEINAPEIEKACENVFRRDYVMFGFSGWTPKH